MSKFKVGEEVKIDGDIYGEYNHDPIITPHSYGGYNAEVVYVYDKADNKGYKYAIKFDNDVDFENWVVREKDLSKLPEKKFKFGDILKFMEIGHRYIVLDYDNKTDEYRLVQFKLDNTYTFKWRDRKFTDKSYKKVGEIKEV